MFPGAGFIGSNLFARLLAEGADVAILDDFITGSREVTSLLKGKGAGILEGRSVLMRANSRGHGLPSGHPILSSVYRENL